MNNLQNFLIKRAYQSIVTTPQYQQFTPQIIPQYPQLTPQAIPQYPQVPGISWGSILNNINKLLAIKPPKNLITGMLTKNFQSKYGPSLRNYLR